MKSKKLFLSSLLLLGLLVTACNNQNQPSEESSEETPSSQVAPSSGAQSSSAQTTSEEDIGIPAPAAGSFAFSDTELATEQEIHTKDQKNYLNYSKEYYRITSSDLNSFNAKGTSNNSAPLPVKIHWNYTPQAGKTVSKYSFVFGQKADLSDGYEVAGTASKNISFYNAFLGTNYFKVIANFAHRGRSGCRLRGAVQLRLRTRYGLPGGGRLSGRLRRRKGFRQADRRRYNQ